VNTNFCIENNFIIDNNFSSKDFWKILVIYFSQEFKVTKEKFNLNKIQFRFNIMSTNIINSRKILHSGSGELPEYRNGTKV
jgi:hypothetical protein